jgi:transposase
MARGQRDRAKEQHWRRHVAAWRRSGQSIRAYCRAEGLSEPSFYAWRRLLAERRRRTQPERVEDGRALFTGQSAAAAPSVSPFVPVRLVEDAAPLAAVEVVLRGGRVVRVAAGFAAKTLREVVAALEDLPC